MTKTTINTVTQTGLYQKGLRDWSIEMTSVQRIPVDRVLKGYDIIRNLAFLWA